MIKIKFFSILFFLCTMSAFAQESLNSYKYVIVPVQYDFQKSEDAYQVNSLVQFLFEKEGFITLMSTDGFPEDLSKDRCLALTAKVNNSSKMLTAKMNMDLVDCNNKVVFSTTEAKTKEKDYKKSYHEIIRKTFEDVKAQNYKYSPVKEEAATKEIANVEQNATTTAIVVPTVVATTEVKEQTIEPKSVATVEENTVNTASAQVVEKKTVAPAAALTATVVEVEEVKVDTDVLYAQAITNGYQLVDSSPKVVYIALKTSVSDIYLIKDKNGIIYKLNGSWVAEYYENGKLLRKSLNVKLL